jgi:hypothetical protein
LELGIFAELSVQESAQSRVDFHSQQRLGLFQQEVSQDSLAGTDLHHLSLRLNVGQVNNFGSDLWIGQKILAEGLFFSHRETRED